MTMVAHLCCISHLGSRINHCDDVMTLDHSTYLQTQEWLSSISLLMSDSLDSDRYDTSNNGCWLVRLAGEFIAVHALLLRQYSLNTIIDTLA